jgi:hypothetical protein
MRKTSEEIREGYRQRLILPEFPDGDSIEFKTKSGTVVARGYERIVVGDRGPYIEFSENQMTKDNLEIPKDQEWRLHWVEFDPNKCCYYWEFRSVDKARVKVYFQRRTVDYADYRVGMYYISPFELVTDRYPVLVRPLAE